MQPKQKINTQKGITLIALIITIILLLILAIVSIKLVMNSGIITRAEKGLNEYSKAQEDETEKLLQLEYEMAKQEGKTTGTFTDYVLETKYNGIKIGDYINYDQTTDAQGNKITEDKAKYISYSKASGWANDQVFDINNYNGGWRVLGIENGKIQLISANIIGSQSAGNTYYYLQGEKGYIEGADELNAISSIYGQGKYAIKARSINIDDINKITGYKPEKVKYGIESIFEFGNKVTYSFENSKVKYSGTNGISGISGYTTFKYYDEKKRNFENLETDKTIDIISNYYDYYPTTLKNSNTGEIKGIEKTSNAWKLLFENTGSRYYWLASPYVGAKDGYSGFGLRAVHYEYIGGNRLFYSNNGNYSDYDGVRPIVTLSSDIQIEKTETNDGSTLAKACTIK